MWLENLLLPRIDIKKKRCKLILESRIQFFFLILFAAVAQNKQNDSCVCLQLAQNSIYAVDMVTTRPT